MFRLLKPPKIYHQTLTDPLYRDYVIEKNVQAESYKKKMS